MLFVVSAAVAIGSPKAGAAQTPEGPRVEVIEVSGPLDHRLVTFVIEAIESAARAGNVEVVILQLDSPGVTADIEQFGHLVDVVRSPPIPLVTWLGPSSAQAQGGVAQLLAAAPLRTAAPGARIGRWAPTIAGDHEAEVLVTAPTAAVLGSLLELDAPVEDLVDRVSADTASPRQLVQMLDGMEVGGEVLSTLRPFVEGDEEGITALVTVYREPGLWDRTLRLASTPEAAFFFLVAGLTVAAFEFFAIGPGIAAAVAAISLLVSSTGLGSLELRWWAVALTVASVWLMAVSYQRGGVVALTGMGLVGLLISGFAFTETGPQIAPSLPGVLLTVAAAAFFFLLAMPTVARSRFSTQTIGRDRLIGAIGEAVDDLDPDGLIEVNGARWSATAHRQAGIGAGDPVEVVAIDEWVLEVAPVES